MNIAQQSWGTAEGKPIYLFTLTNKNGQQVSITNYGCIITSWLVKDRDNKVQEMVLGFNSPAPYLIRHAHLGAIAGRVANRIANGKFSIDGTLYTLATNNGKNHLHGGSNGMDKQVWDAEITAEQSLRLSYLSPDGEEGYPGNLQVSVLFSFNDANELSLTFSATTDRTTPVNLTNHSYFNLSGNASQDILDHELLLHATHYTPLDDTQIPTGEIANVLNTPFDFTTPHTLGGRIADVPGGYDHNYVLDNQSGQLRQVALLTHKKSGRQLTVATDLPGLQLYTGNSLNGSLIAADGHPMERYAGVCLETQGFPDAVNHPHFPSVWLHPGEQYHTVTTFRITETPAG